MDSKRIPIWLDCDPGHDDAMAIILAAYNPKLNLLGISTTHGNAPVEHTTKNACKLVYTCGIEGVDIVKGAEAAICHQPGERVSEMIHGYDGLGTKNNQKFPNTNVEPLKKNAYVHMCEKILASPEQVKVIATGNLTNIAILLKAFPEVKANISAIVFMGGAINFGNASPSAEANIFNDPDAADIVCRSGLEIVMVPLDVTHTVLVTPEIIKKIDGMKSQFANLCIGILQFFADAYRDVYGFDSPPLHDPCAVAYCIAPELFEVKFCNTRIERVSDSTRGRTVCDMYGVTNLPKNVHVTTKIDVPKFWEMMLAALEVANSRSRME